MVPFGSGIGPGGGGGSLCCDHKQPSNLRVHPNKDVVLAHVMYPLPVGRGGVLLLCAVIVLSLDPRLAVQPPAGILPVTSTEGGVRWGSPMALGNAWLEATQHSCSQSRGRSWLLGPTQCKRTGVRELETFFEQSLQPPQYPWIIHTKGHHLGDVSGWPSWMPR